MRRRVTGSEAEILAEHREMLCRFMLFLTQDADLSEEIVQEAFRVAISKGTNPQKGTNYGAWLRSIARNLLRNHMRKKRRRWLFYDNRLIERAESYFIRHGTERWEQRRTALLDCINKLPTPDQRLIIRRYHYGEKVKDIATESGIQPNTLSKRLERIRNTLRQCIGSVLKENYGE